MRGIYIYYTPQRPPAPGAIPARGLMSTHTFADRSYVKQLGRRVWGMAIYDRELTQTEIEDYELVGFDPNAREGHGHEDSGEVEDHAGNRAQER